MKVNTNARKNSLKTMNALMGELKSDKNILDLSRNDAYRDLADDYYDQMSQVDIWKALRVARYLGLGGLWRGDTLALMVLDMAMNSDRRLFANIRNEEND